VLAERWPESEGAWTCAAARATEDIDLDSGFSTSVQLLALVWPDRRETEELLLQLAKKRPSNKIVVDGLSYVIETKKRQRLESAQLPHEQS
jgi:hypothetical protein